MKPLTIVSLGEDARKAVAKRMQQRGETGGSYFSSGQHSYVAPDSSAIGPAEAPDNAIRRALGIKLADVGISEAEAQIRIQAGLLGTPWESRARSAAWIKKNLGADVPAGPSYVAGRFSNPGAEVSGTSGASLNAIASLPDEAVSRLSKRSGGETQFQADAVQYAKLLTGVKNRVSGAKSRKELLGLSRGLVPGSTGKAAEVSAMAGLGYSAEDLESLGSVVNSSVLQAAGSMATRNTR